MPTGVVGDSIDGTLRQRGAEGAEVGKGTHEMDPLTRANLGAVFNNRQSDIFIKKLQEVDANHEICI